MCAPIALGVASAAAGAMGAVGQYQSASAQASAQNAAAISNYKYQLKVRERNWDQTRFIYGRKIAEFKNQLNENNLAAGKAYAGAQNRLNELYKQAAFKQQGMLSKLVQSQGKVAASGRSGRSADRVSAAMDRTYGMNLATQAESLTSAQRAYTNTTNLIRDQLRSRNNQAYQNVAIQPQPDVAPPRPVMTPGPSGLGLATGLLQAGISGFGAYQDAKLYQGKLPGE